MPIYYPPGTRKRNRFFVVRGQIDGREYEGGTRAGDEDDHETSTRGTRRRIRQGLQRPGDTGKMGLKEAIFRLIDDAAPKPGPRGSYKKRGMTDVAGRS